VCCGWGKDLTLFALWVKWLFVGLLEAYGWPIWWLGLCWVVLMGKGCYWAYLGMGDRLPI